MVVGVGDETGALAAAEDGRDLAALLDICKILVSTSKRARLVVWKGRSGGLGLEQVIRAINAWLAVCIVKQHGHSKSLKLCLGDVVKEEKCS